MHRAEPPLILIPRAFSRGVAHKISIMQSAPRVSPVVRSTLGATSSRPGQKLIRSSEIRASLPANSPPSLPPSRKRERSNLWSNLFLRIPSFESSSRLSRALFVHTKREKESTVVGAQDEEKKTEATPLALERSRMEGDEVCFFSGVKNRTTDREPR